MVESLSTKERNVYEHSVAIKVSTEYKISAVDVHGKALYLKKMIDSVMVIGSEKGYVYPFDIID
jgi:hypothetical protein